MQRSEERSRIGWHKGLIVSSCCPSSNGLAFSPRLQLILLGVNTGRNMRHRTREVELLRAQLKELQQATAEGNTDSKNTTHVQTPNSPSASDCGLSVQVTSVQASTSRGFDSPSSMPDTLTEWEWMGDSYLNTVHHFDTPGACLAWTANLDHTLASEVGMKAETTPVSAPASVGTPAGPSTDLFPLGSLMPISPNQQSSPWQQPLDLVPAPHPTLGAGIQPNSGEGDGMGMAFLPASPQPPDRLIQGQTSAPGSKGIASVEDSPRPNSSTDLHYPLSSSPLSSYPDTQARDSCTYARQRTLDHPGTSEPILHLAVAHGNIDVLRFLIQDCQMPVNVRDRAGYTPLQRAVINGRTDMAALLIEYGANPS